MKCENVHEGQGESSEGPRSGCHSWEGLKGSRNRRSAPRDTDLVLFEYKTEVMTMAFYMVMFRNGEVYVGSFRNYRRLSHTMCLLSWRLLTIQKGHARIPSPFKQIIYCF